MLSSIPWIFECYFAPESYSLNYTVSRLKPRSQNNDLAKHFFLLALFWSKAQNLSQPLNHRARATHHYHTTILYVHLTRLAIPVSVFPRNVHSQAAIRSNPTFRFQRHEILDGFACGSILRGVDATYFCGYHERRRSGTSRWRTAWIADQ